MTNVEQPEVERLQREIVRLKKQNSRLQSAMVRMERQVASLRLALFSGLNLSFQYATAVSTSDEGLRKKSLETLSASTENFENILNDSAFIEEDKIDAAP